jgi:hypothetical protein
MTKRDVEAVGPSKCPSTGMRVEAHLSQWSSIRSWVPGRRRSCDRGELLPAFGLRPCLACRGRDRGARRRRGRCGDGESRPTPSLSRTADCVSLRSTPTLRQAVA